MALLCCSCPPLQHAGEKHARQHTRQALETPCVHLCLLRLLAEAGMPLQNCEAPMKLLPLWLQLLLSMHGPLHH